MKKLYSIALAAAVAFSASAGTPEVKQINTAKAINKATAIASNIKIEKKAADAQPMKVAAANDNKSIDGLYTITIGDYYLTSGTQSAYDADATIVDNGDGTITIECVDFFDPVTAEYDAVAGTVTFKTDATRTPVAMPNGSTYYTAFTPFAWTTTIVPGDYTVNYKDGVFDFPADHGFSWPAYATEDATTAQGYFNIFDVVSLAKDDAVLYEDAQWTGNFLTLLFPGTSDVDPVSTTVVYSEDTKTYKIQNAFAATYAQLGFSSVSPDVKVVATDPDNCIVPETTTKIKGGDTDGIYFVLSQSANTSDPSTVDEAFRIKLTEDDETITIVFPEKSMYLWPSNTTKLYYANQVESKLVVKKKSASAINDVNVEGATEAPVYYNLQGVRVAEPQNGLFIEVRGNKAVKVIK